MARAQTKAPGTQYYMPPDALSDNPQYGVELDVFSFGHLALYTITQVPPEPDDSKITSTAVERGEVQIAKREATINIMGRDHCLCPLIMQCLQDRPERRPITHPLIDLDVPLLEYSKPPTPLPQVISEMNEPQPPPAAETKDRVSLMATGIYVQPPPQLQDNISLVAPAQFLTPPPQATRERVQTGIPQDNPQLMVPVQASDHASTATTSS